MTDEEHHTIRTLARSIINELLDDKRFKGYVREACLHVMVQMDKARQAGLIRSIVDGCMDLGVRLFANDEGKIRCTNGSKLSSGMRGLIRENHCDLKEYLTHVRDTELLTKGNANGKASQRPGTRGDAKNPRDP